MATKGQAELVGMTRAGDYIVRPVGHGSGDVFTKARKIDNMIDISVPKGLTRVQKKMQKFGLRLTEQEAPND